MFFPPSSSSFFHCTGNCFSISTGIIPANMALRAYCVACRKNGIKSFFLMNAGSSLEKIGWMVFPLVKTKIVNQYKEQGYYFSIEILQEFIGFLAHYRCVSAFRAYPWCIILRNEFEELRIGFILLCLKKPPAFPGCRFFSFPVPSKPVYGTVPSIHYNRVVEQMP